jgi:hypothetical protein
MNREQIVEGGRTVTVHLSDILREPTSGEFQSDVQVTDYRSAKNQKLLKSYIFTSNAPAGKYSSVDLLRRFCEAYGPGARENRFVVIATYGHGKSHFALALANFFGKPFDSEESRTVLKAIRHAIPDSDLGTYGFLEDFKRNHKTYLVLILRGDQPTDLPTKFYRAVREALAEEEHTGEDVPLPFWFGVAAEFLQKIDPAFRDRANAFLKQYNLDLPLLLQQVRDGEAATHDICIALHEELYGTRPKLDEGVSLKDAVAWLIENKCGEGHPYAGLLVLFDEFSSFVEQYAHSPLRGTVLQDLLNGISDARERAAFIAFAQQDPNQVARRSSTGDVQNRIIQELGRLPTERRWQLHSSMEEVLESYLRKGGETWLRLLQPDSSFAAQLDAATTTTLRLFKGRYLDGLKWTLDRFHTVVTAGCYPLHPLTTSILCSVELKMTPDPRSVLGFIRIQLERKSNESVETAGKPNWVRAVELVDHFGPMLDGDNAEWGRYCDALAQVSIADDPDEVLVLKAMLLHTVAKLTAEGYDRTIAELTGLSVPVALETLSSLSRRGIIRKDSELGRFSLWPRALGRNIVEIMTEKARQITLDAPTLAEALKELEGVLFDPIMATVEWGSREDWSFGQALIVRDLLTSSYLNGVMSNRLRWTLDGGVRERPRGFIIWAIAQNEDDVAWYRKRIPELLQEVCQNNPIPIIVMRPTLPSTDLVDEIKRYLALKNFTSQEKSTVGADVYRSMLQQIEEELRRTMANFKDTCTPEVPPAFRAQFNRSEPSNLTNVAVEIVRMAYPYSPKSWFTQYRQSQRRLSSAVVRVSDALRQNARIDPTTLQPGPETDMVNSYLTNAWRVLDASHRVVEPAPGTALRPAWDEIERYFAPGDPDKLAKPILEKLLNSPFGYDWNTLALLFSAWRGFHRFDLRVSGNSPSVGTGLQPLAILQANAALQFSRRDVGALRREIEEIVQRAMAGTPVPRTLALEMAQKLREFLAREDEDTAVRERVDEAYRRLEDGIERVRQYDEEAKRIRLEAEKPTLDRLIDCLDRIQRLPSITIVEHEQPPPQVLRNLVDRQINHRVVALCNQYAKLAQLVDYTSNLEKLTQVKRSLAKHGLTSFIPLVEEAVQKLDQARVDLEAKQKSESERQLQISMINGAPTRGPISTLRQALASLQDINPATAEIRAARDRKLELIQREITRLEDVPASIATRLAEVASRRDVNALRGEASRAQALCDEGSAHSQIDALLERVNQIESFFAELEAIEHHGRQGPGDFDRDLERIQALLTDGAPFLSDSQRAVANRLATGIRDELNARQDRAVKQLARFRAELQAGASPGKLQGDLDRAEVDWTFLPDQSRSVLDKLRANIREAIKRAEEERRREQERQEEISRISVVISGLPTKGPMSVLHQSLSQLDALSVPEELREAWERKRQQINEEFNRLAALPEQYARDLDSASSRHKVEECRANLLRIENLCDEGDTQAKIKACLDRCDALRDYFERVDQVRHQSRRSPGDYDRVLERLGEIVAAGPSDLSPTHRAVTERLCGELQSELTAKRRKASQHLENLRDEFKKGSDILRIQADIDRTDWSFLPPDEETELKSLQRDVQTQIDQDEAKQVEIHFLRIKDLEQRRRCLEALQSLVGEVV